MTDSQLPNGSRIGQYEIREFIAQGGMAEVYLAALPTDAITFTTIQHRKW